MHIEVPRVPTTSRLSKASREAEAESCLASLSKIDALNATLANEKTRAILHSAAGNAPYLARLMTKYPESLIPMFIDGFDAAWKLLEAEITALAIAQFDQPTMMLKLRQLKAKAALTAAMADISGEWKLTQVTAALSRFAGDAVTATLRHLLHKAAQRNEFTLIDTAEPESGTGIIILGMGKLGAFELNYSSDIDLIVLFDNAVLPYKGTRNAQHFMNKIASDLTTILQERTSEGYVFRTDLRLRPDPMSTPLAVTTAAALTYYETVGQNWERAAMIKARPIAGDSVAATGYMRELVPFIWRKTLDFATIADIHSIKRQMNVKGGKDIELYGHNIKTGVGGIREIEFFVQTQQLVWGGRIPELRVPGTIAGLNALTQYELVSPEVRDALTIAYEWLRTVEHRLQMRNDEQTHTLPVDNDAMHEVALFSSYDSTASFAKDCLTTLTAVHTIYTDSMLDSEPLAVDGNLVFTGVEADPETLKTLKNLGYTDTQRISDIIQGWHRGSRRSTRSKRSRQVLTELVPALLTALGKTANPDAAFFNFDDFIDRLPSGAQIFMMFLTRPEMLRLLADILGSAPALGDTLSANPSLLDGVLESDFFLGLPSKEELENLVTERLRFAHGFEQKMLYLRIFNNEKRFQAGVHLLKRLATAKRVGAFLSDIAEIILQCTMVEVTAEYWANFSSTSRGEAGRGADANDNASMSPPPSLPPIGGGTSAPFAVLALGKLGGREMTFGSDLDIVLVYDDANDAASEARRDLTRISQRFVSALTLLTREGRLYEVDTRLRPGGSDGPLAVSLAAFDAYFTNSAWTYEHMALTRARVVATNCPKFAGNIEEVVRKHIFKKRDASALLKDVLDMRQRIATQFPTRNPWALKHIRGGMVDMDFIAQYLVLRYAGDNHALWHRSCRQVFEAAQADVLLDASVTIPLIIAKKFMSDLMSLLRLSAPGGVITDEAPTGLKNLLVNGMRAENFDALKQQLMTHEAHVQQIFERMAKDELKT